jgi:hypothetical protein
MTGDIDPSDTPGRGAQPGTDDSEISRSRKRAGSAVLWLGILLALAAAALYEALVLTSPPPDYAHMRLRGVIGLYLGIPILIMGGIIWPCNWLAARIDPQRRRRALPEGRKASYRA